ncbi:MAG: 3-oxoacyl-ACP synthase [Candidatus Midichloriaceae bacterium]|jgi:3-oxoacyl-[acyl-carrier-protein] synthase II|nr:3-oxoacyl-ACP synthase [Candidatus Midichloriaceae bacterium]
MKRVVVTGVGCITSLGGDIASTWDNLLKAKSGITKIPDFLFDTSDLATKIAGIVPGADQANGLDINKYVPVKDQKKMDRFIHLAMAAAEQAIEDSGWVADNQEKSEYTGVIIGSGIGGLSTIEENSIILKERGPRRISPFFIPASLINLSSGMVSIKHNFKGPNHSVVTACATGAHAIADAARLIGCGEAKVMIAGGSEAAVSRLGIAGFNACRALSTAFNDTPTRASRPWDKDRDGFVMGEGAGIMVIEEYEHAKKRGAKIYAEILSYAYSGDAYHITAPAEDGEGGYRAMKKALERAQISAEKVDYVNAHGTSTPPGDMAEISALKNLFGSDIHKTSISSTKSAIGHLLGAAGVVESIFSVLTIKDGIIPPTLNLENPSEGCEGIDLVPLKAKEKAIKIAMSNSFGFGGTNVTLVFGSA